MSCSVAKKKLAASFSAERSCTAQPLQGPNPSPRHVPLLPDSLNKFSMIDKLFHSASWKMMPTV
ncbi:MAG: hypothetical protein ACREAS_05365 [Nitrososphaera sp.]